MIIKVIAKPNAKIDKMEWKNEELHIKIKTKPIDNEANNYIIEYLSKSLKIAKSHIFIKSGHKSKIKLLDIDINILDWNLLMKLI